MTRPGTLLLSGDVDVVMHTVMFVKCHTFKCFRD